MLIRVLHPLHWPTLYIPYKYERILNCIHYSKHSVYTCRNERPYDVITKVKQRNNIKNKLALLDNAECVRVYNSIHGYSFMSNSSLSAVIATPYKARIMRSHHHAGQLYKQRIWCTCLRRKCRKLTENKCGTHVYVASVWNYDALTFTWLIMPPSIHCIHTPTMFWHDYLYHTYVYNYVVY